MATLAAVKLNAEFCLNISGQYLIPKDLNNPYYNLAEIMLEYTGCIFYFFPSKCESDRRHYQLVEGIGCLKEFLFNDTKHAATMLVGNLSYIIGLEKEKLLALYEKNKGKEINKLVFLLQTVPFFAIFGIMWKELKGFVIRRMGKHCNGI